MKILTVALCSHSIIWILSCNCIINALSQTRATTLGLIEPISQAFVPSELCLFTLSPVKSQRLSMASNCNATDIQPSGTEPCSLDKLKSY